MIRMTSGIVGFLALVLGTALSAPASLGVTLASSASSAHHASGHQEFLAISTTGGAAPLAAMGAIHAHGKDVTVNDRTDKFVFPAGTLVIKHKMKSHSGVQSSDSTACLFTFHEKGTWKVGKGSTGAYAHATGDGRYTVLGEGIGCDPDKAPEAFYTRIEAEGTLSY